MKFLQTVGQFDLYYATLGPTTSNTYLIVDNLLNFCLLIDPALDAECSIDAFLRNRGFDLKGVLCTHGHFDHVGSAVFFQRKYGCQVYVDKEDFKTVKKSKFLMYMVGVKSNFESPSITELENLPEFISLPELTVFNTPGHTPGSCVIKFGQWYFTGDTIYAHGLGLSNLPGEDKALLRESIVSVLPLMDNDGYIFPGHGPSIRFTELLKCNQRLKEFLYA